MNRIAEQLGFTDVKTRLGWKATNAGVAALAAMGTNWLLHEVWLATRKTEPPLNPASHDTGWREAVLWAGVLGLAVGVAQLAARRGAAEGWNRYFGTYPRGL